MGRNLTAAVVAIFVMLYIGTAAVLSAYQTVEGLKWAAAVIADRF